MTPPPRLLCFGEIVWDVVGADEYIGGAPFNLAAHAVRLGLAADLYSRVGRDPRGRRAVASIQRLGVGTDWLQHDEQSPTGWVGVRLHQGQPEYFFPEPIAWDVIAPPSPDAVAKLRDRTYDALCFGTLAQRAPGSREALRALRRELPNTPGFYDINFRPPHTPLELVLETLPGTTLVKVNDEEARLLAAALCGGDLARLASCLRERFGTAVLIITRGEHGCRLVTAGETLDLPGLSVQVASAVGAGDAFSAAFLAQWLQGRPLREAAQTANRIGAWVASRPEAIPDSPPLLEPASP